MTTLSEAERFGSELEVAIEAIADGVPDAVYERLGSHRYLAKRHPVRRTVLVGAPIAAASATVAVLVTGFGPTTQVAFAGWTATPTTPAAGQVVSAEKLCLATANADLGSERSTRMQQTLLGTPEGSFQSVVVDTRGPYTLVVMSVAGTVGKEDAACLTGPGALAARPQLETSTGRFAPPPAPDAVGTTGWGSGGTSTSTPASPPTSTSSTRPGADTVLLGTVGTTVSTVTLGLTNGRSVTASVANGMYAAWWPGVVNPATATARTESGTTATRSFEPVTGGQKLKITAVHAHATVTGQP